MLPSPYTAELCCTFREYISNMKIWAQIRINKTDKYNIHDKIIFRVHSAPLYLECAVNNIFMIKLYVECTVHNYI